MKNRKTQTLSQNFLKKLNALLGRHHNLSTSWLTTVAIISLTGASCLPGGEFYKKASSPSAGVTAITATIEGDKAVATFSASANVTQVVEAPSDSNLKGVSLSMQPGTLSIDMTVSLEEATSLNSGASASSFGITFDSAAGNAVNIENDAGIVEIPAESPPMALQIPIFPSNGLWLQESTSLVVFFRRESGAGSCEEEIFPPNRFQVVEEAIKIEVRKFGAYQALRIPTEELIKKLASSSDGRITLTRPGCQIITKTEKKQLPEVSISELQIAEDNRKFELSAIVKGDEIDSCLLFMKERVSDTEVTQQSDSASFRVDFSENRLGITARAAISCTTKSGQEVGTPFRRFDLDPDKSFEFEAVYKNKGLDFKSSLKANEVQWCRILIDGVNKGPWGSETIRHQIDIKDPARHREEIPDVQGEIEVQFKMICKSIENLTLSSNVVELIFSEPIIANPNAINARWERDVDGAGRTIISLDYYNLNRLTGFDFQKATNISAEFSGLNSASQETVTLDNTSANREEFFFPFEPSETQDYQVTTLNFTNDTQNLELIKNDACSCYLLNGNPSKYQPASFFAEAPVSPPMTRTNAIRLFAHENDWETITLQIDTSMFEENTGFNLTSNPISADITLEPTAASSSSIIQSGLSSQVIENGEKLEININATDLAPMPPAGMIMYYLGSLKLYSGISEIILTSNSTQSIYLMGSASSNLKVAFLEIIPPHDGMQMPIQVFLATTESTQAASHLILTLDAAMIETETNFSFENQMAKATLMLTTTLGNVTHEYVIERTNFTDMGGTASPILEGKIDVTNDNLAENRYYLASLTLENINDQSITLIATPDEWSTRVFTIKDDTTPLSFLVPYLGADYDFEIVLTPQTDPLQITSSSISAEDVKYCELIVSGSTRLSLNGMSFSRKIDRRYHVDDPTQFILLTEDLEGEVDALIVMECESAQSEELLRSQQTPWRSSIPIDYSTTMIADSILLPYERKQLALTLDLAKLSEQISINIDTLASVTDLQIQITDNSTTQDFSSTMIRNHFDFNGAYGEHFTTIYFDLPSNILMPSLISNIKLYNESTIIGELIYSSSSTEYYNLQQTGSSLPTELPLLSFYPPLRKPIEVFLEPQDDPTHNGAKAIIEIDTDQLPSGLNVDTLIGQEIIIELSEMDLFAVDSNTVYFDFSPGNWQDLTGTDIKYQEVDLTQEAIYLFTMGSHHGFLVSSITIGSTTYEIVEDSHQNFIYETLGIPGIFIKKLDYTY